MTRIYDRARVLTLFLLKNYDATTGLDISSKKQYHIYFF